MGAIPAARAVCTIQNIGSYPPPPHTHTHSRERKWLVVDCLICCWEQNCGIAKFLNADRTTVCFEPWQTPRAMFGSCKTGLSPQYLNTDRWKAVLLLWFLTVTCSCCPCFTPGNVVRGNQKLCKGNLYGYNRPWLSALEKGKQAGECSYSRNI